MAGKKSDNINRSKGTPIIRFPDTDFKINMLKAFKEIKDREKEVEIMAKKVIKFGERQT